MQALRLQLVAVGVRHREAPIAGKPGQGAAHEVSQLAVDRDPLPRILRVRSQRVLAGQQIEIERILGAGAFRHHGDPSSLDAEPYRTTALSGASLPRGPRSRGRG